MADSGKPLLWKVFDAVEGAVAPRLEEAVRSDAFLGGLGLAARAQAAAKRTVEARARAIWHLVNLPAGSDVARLRREVAALDRELRRVSVSLDRALARQQPPEEVPNADAPRGPGNGRGPGSHSPGRRAQRASRA